ncbi:MAG: Do family serine endopeptidase [Bacteroidaceae bacterium]
MRNLLKSAFIALLLVAVSVSASVATFYYLQKDTSDQPKSFSQLFANGTALIKKASYSNVVTPQPPVDLTRAANVSVHAVVHIKSTQHSKIKSYQTQPDVFDFFFGDGQSRRRQVKTQPRVGFGSGVIISKDGYIVTNNHVIDKSDEIQVTLNDNRHFAARLIGTDPNTDLALLKITGDEDFPTLPVGDSDLLKVGEWVLAVGNPFNLTSTVTAGIVSAKARTLGVYNGGIESFIQTDAAINRGNSGGALVNAKGELVGINAVLSSPTGVYTGYGFAIPTSIMAKVVADLRQYGTVQRALLGIMGQDINDSLSEDLSVSEGVYVVDVTDESAASVAGIQKKDVITAVDGKAINNMAELQEAMVKHRPGDTVTVTLLRNKKEMKLKLVLKNSQGTTKIMKDLDIDVLGAAFKELSSDLKKQLNLGYGLQVAGISKGKMADAGLRKGFIILKVNGKRMNSVEDLTKQMHKAAHSPEQVLFISGVYPSGKRANYAVDLSDE